VGTNPSSVFLAEPNASVLPPSESTSKVIDKTRLGLNIIMARQSVIWR